MGFATGAAISPVDLLDKLQAFLVAQGWASNLYAVDGTGKRAHLNKDGLFVHLRSAIAENAWHSHYNSLPAASSIAMYITPGFSGSAAWDDQAGGPVTGDSNAWPIGVAMVLPPGPVLNYYFFATGDDIVVVVEKSSGIYTHLGWGPSLTKFGTWTGGAYFFGAVGYYNSSPGGGAGTRAGIEITADCPGAANDAFGLCGCYVQAVVDSFTGWISISSNNAPVFGFTGRIGTSSVPNQSGTGIRAEIPNYGRGLNNTPPILTINLQTSRQDGRANLLPVTLWVLRDATTTGFSPIGAIPNVFASNAVGNGFSKASEYVIGSDTYKLFPNFAVLKT